MTPHQVEVAGEAYAACVFSQAGFDVLVQYGADQPLYDLVVIRDSTALRISVKSSQHAAWGLIQGYKAGRSYEEAADAWMQKQDKKVLFCLVTFAGVDIGDSPRCYLATAREIAGHMKTAKCKTTTLSEDHLPKRGVGKGQRFSIPREWRFSIERVESFLR
jgi:hypothetical protein